MRYSLLLVIFIIATKAEANPLMATIPAGIANIFSSSLPNNLKQICRNIEAQAKRPFGERTIAYCKTQIGEDVKNRNQLLDACYVLLSETDNVYDSCVNEFKIHYNLADNELLSAESELLGKHDTSLLGKEELRGAYSSALYSCQPKDIGVCTDASAQFTIPFTDLMTQFPGIQEDTLYTFVQPSYDMATCYCLEEALNDKYSDEKLTNLTLKEQTAKHKKIINGLIERSIGKKFINDFSVGLEDVNYYLTNNFKALKNDLNSASDLQCNDINKFQQAMDKSCAENGIDAKTREENLNSLLDNYVNVKQHPTFQSKINALSREILNSDADKNARREAYDIARLGIVNQSPKLHFMNQLLTNIMSDPSLHQDFDTSRDIQEDTPGEVLNNLLERMDKGALQAKIDLIIKQGKKGKLTKEQKEFYSNMELLNRSVNKSEIKKLIRDSADFSVMQYPGYRALFKDFNLFNKVMKMGVSDSVIKTLESNPGLLSEHYENNCNRLVTQIAEAACTPKSDYVQKASPDELNKLLNVTQLDIDPEVKDLLLCQTNQGKKFSKIDGLLFENHRMLLSDYAQKTFNPSEFNKTGFDNYQSSLRPNSNTRTSSYFNAASNAGAEIRTTLGIDKLLAQNQFASKEQVKMTTPTPIKTPVESPKITEKFESSFPTTQPSAANYSVSPMQSTVAKSWSETQPESKLDSKALLREFLADESNKEEVEKHLSNASSEDIQKLMDLKDQIAKDEARLNELIRQTDQVKLQAMENNLKMMEEEIKTSSKKEKIVERRSDSSFYQNGFQGTLSQQNNINDTSYREASRGVDTSSVGSAKTSSSRSSSGALAGGSRAPASIPDIARAINRDSQDGVIVIESSIVRTPGKAVAREELSKEIISYVNSSQLNLSDLIKLKESGLVLKVKSLEDGKEVEEEIRINYNELTSEAQLLLENKIAGVEKENEYERLKRDYSYQTLKLILATKAQSGT